MKISDETLMAYADGEGDAAARLSVETAMREDPHVAQRVAHHRAMREAMGGAFSAVIREPVPERLVAAARGRADVPARADGTVVSLAEARVASVHKSANGTARRWQPLAIAASLLLGIGVGYWTWHGAGTLVESHSDGLVAGAALAEALSTQLSEDRSNRVAVTGVSFRDKAGQYCRTFSFGDAFAAAGLACRQGGDWKIKVLAQSAGGNHENFRPAGSDMPSAVRAAVEESIAGEPLDRAGEVAARQAGWAGPIAENRSQ